MQDQKSANIKGIEDRDKKQTKSSVDVTIRDKSRRHSPSDNTAYHQNKSNSKNSPRIEKERTRQEGERQASSTIRASGHTRKERCSIDDADLREEKWKRKGERPNEGFGV